MVKLYSLLKSISNFLILHQSSIPGASSSSKDSTELISSDELSSVAASAASFVAYLDTYSL